MKYAYPIVITHEPEDGAPSYLVTIPDFSNGITQGESIPEALLMAQDWLAASIEYLEDKNEDIPMPSTVLEVQKLFPDCIVNLVPIDTEDYRLRFGTQSTKKTLTIPAWLNTRAEAAGINFSQTLQEALKEKLAI